jgi:hypothetical protein
VDAALQTRGVNSSLNGKGAAISIWRRPYLESRDWFWDKRGIGSQFVVADEVVGLDLVSLSPNADRLRQPQIPIEPAARPHPITRDFVPGRFSDVGQSTPLTPPRRHPKNLHRVCRTGIRAAPVGIGGTASDGYGSFVNRANDIRGGGAIVTLM